MGLSGSGSEIDFDHFVLFALYSCFRNTKKETQAKDSTFPSPVPWQLRPTGASAQETESSWRNAGIGGVFRGCGWCSDEGRVRCGWWNVAGIYSDHANNSILNTLPGVPFCLWRIMTSFLLSSQSLLLAPGFDLGPCGGGLESASYSLGRQRRP
jgi:hypothetical protein